MVNIPDYVVSMMGTAADFDSAQDRSDILEWERLMNVTSESRQLRRIRGPHAANTIGPLVASCGDLDGQWLGYQAGASYALPLYTIAAVWLLIACFAIKLPWHSSQASEASEVQCDATAKTGELIKQGISRLAAKSTVRISYSARMLDGTTVSVMNCPDAIVVTRLDHHSMLRGLSEGLIGKDDGARFKLTMPAEKAYGQFGLLGMIPPDVSLIIEGTVTVPSALRAGCYDFDKADCLFGVETTWQSAYQLLRSMYIRQGVYSGIRHHAEEISLRGAAWIISQQDEDGSWVDCIGTPPYCLEEGEATARCFCALASIPLWARSVEVDSALDKASAAVSAYFKADGSADGHLRRSPALWLYAAACIIEIRRERPTPARVLAEKVVMEWLRLAAQGDRLGALIDRESTANVSACILERVCNDIGGSSIELIRRGGRGALSHQAPVGSSGWALVYLKGLISPEEDSPQDGIEPLSAYGELSGQSTEQLLTTASEEPLALFFELLASYQYGSPMWDGVEGSVVRRIVEMKSAGKSEVLWKAPAGHCRGTDLVLTAEMVLALGVYNRYVLR